MIEVQELKHVNVIAPAAIKDNASWTVNDVDTLGFSHCLVVFMLGASDIAVAALKMQECDTSGGSFVDIDNLDYSSDGTLPSATDDNKLFGFDIPLQGRKRFLRLVATAGDGSSGTYGCAYALLSRGNQVPTTASERGFSQILIA